MSLQKMKYKKWKDEMHGMEELEVRMEGGVHFLSREASSSSGLRPIDLFDGTIPRGGTTDTHWYSLTTNQSL